MIYSKPTLVKSKSILPPVTVNFAPPAVETGEDIKSFEDSLNKRIVELFGIKPNPDDPRLSESAKQI